VHGITVRAIGAFTDAELDFRPQPAMRTPRELIFHLYAQEKLLSEDDVNRGVESPLGTYPAWQYFNFAYDEHWHHRGQLHSYLRLLGKEPPMLYDYGAGVRELR
jgi:hypothetical protein